MARNIEIKARLDNRAEVEARLTELNLSCQEVLHQHDTFYGSAMGRLKLRRFSDRMAELIYYERQDDSAAKESFYLLSKTEDAENLHASLTRSNGIRGEVKKVRHLYFMGRTRIHMDQVVGLGDFLELEVVMHEGDDSHNGVAEANEILAQLGVPQAACLSGAYIDLLLQGAA
jgi:adenylate cyclase